MLSEQEKYDVLEKVLKSGTFRKTTTSSVLLKLLVDATIEEKVLSAYSIGLELFGKHFDPDKIEVNTRSNVYNLRKKLKRYYTEEGKNDKVQLKIESGSYKVIFTELDNEPQKRTNKKLFFLGGLVVCVLLAMLLFGVNFSNKTTIWKPLLKSDKPTTLFLGEVFGFFGETPFSKRGWIRDFHINSSEEFYDAVRKDPEQYSKYKPADYNYVVFENALVIKPFTTYFLEHNEKFNISLISDFNTKLIKDKNTIYAGPLFIDTNITALFNKFSKNTKITGNIAKKHYVVELKNSQIHKDTIIEFSAKPESEYAIASCFKGPNDTYHYMFLSNRGMGLNAVVDYFTKKNSLKEFHANFSEDSEEFTALFYVKGKDRTSIDLDLIFFDDNQ